VSVTGDRLSTELPGEGLQFVTVPGAPPESVWLDRTTRLSNVTQSPSLRADRVK